MCEPRNRDRDRALQGLAGITRRLRRTAEVVEDVIKIRVYGREFQDWLRERLTLTLVLRTDNKVIKGKFTPDFLLKLPQVLRGHANLMSSLLTELRRELSARRVNQYIYIAQLIVYISEVTGKHPTWKTIADLVEISGIAAGSSQAQIEPELVRKNCASFKKRNSDLYDEIRRAVKVYVVYCSQLPKSDKVPSFITWKRSRFSAL